MTIYLREHEPKRSQFRSPRRQKLVGVIGVHTAESVMDTVGPDTGAENVADFIRRRTDPGSYHDLVDSDSVVQLVDYDDEAYHIATHTLNRRTTGLSFACRTSDWAKMSPAKRTAFLRNGARAAARQARHHHKRTGIVVPAKRITLAEALAGKPGFLAHGDADPGRRSDPGTRAPHLFPWDEFLDHYRTEAADLLGGTPPSKDGFLMALTDDQQERVLDLLEAADVKLIALEQRLTRLEAANNTDGNDKGKPPYLPRLIASNGRLEAVVADIKGTVADLAAAVTTNG